MDEQTIDLRGFSLTVVQEEGNYIIITKKEHQELYERIPELSMKLRAGLSKEKAWQLAYELGEYVESVLIKQSY